MSGKRARTVTGIGLTMLAVGAGLAVSGCADFSRVTHMTPRKVDTTSSVAAEVAAASRAKTKRPSFRDVPPIPADVRPATAFGVAAKASEAQRDQLAAWVAANPPENPLDAQATEAFAAAQRARIPADQRVTEPPSVGSEEYAARLRDIAKPPPSTK